MTDHPVTGRVPELTVSMPAHNARRHIGAAIRSVLQQAGVDLELVVVDDGSSDGTADMVRATHDPRLRLISTRRRQGDVHCHNLVTAESRAAFIAHLRPHDLVLPGALPALVQAARRAPDVGLVHGYSFEIDEDGGITRETFRARRRLLLRTRMPGADYRRELLRSELAVDPFRIYRREVLQDLGGLDEHCGEAAEYDVALKIADRFTIVLVPVFVCARRQPAPLGWVGGRARALTQWRRRLLYWHRLRRSGTVRFVNEPRYNPYRLLASRLDDAVGIRAMMDALRRRGGELRRRAAVTRSRAWRRLVDRGYEALIARLTWWPLVSPRSPRSRGAPPIRRIAYYTWHFPTLSETFVHRELAALKRAGLAVIILAEAPEALELVDSDAVSLLADTEYVGGADRRQVRPYHWRFLRSRPLRYASLLVYVMSRRYGPLKSLGEDLALFSRCVHVAGVLEGRVHHVHSPWADRSAFIASVAARLLGLTYSVQARAHDVHRTSYLVGLEDRFAHAEFVGTNTRYNLEHLKSFVPRARQSRLVLVYNGIEPARFVPRSGRGGRPGRPRLVCVARLIEQKGLGELLQACRILERQGYEFVCEVIGAAEVPLYTTYFVRLMQLHRRLGLEERVRFLGAKPLAEVIAHYQEADIFVLPCVIAADGSRDITPNALIEAMAMKLAAVSTTVTGVPEIVETEVSGLLVPPADPDALAGALARVIRDPELRTHLGENARVRIEQRFDIDANIATYVRLFRGEILDAR